MDEFTPGNSDRQRRGRVAWERWATVTERLDLTWDSLPLVAQDAWCHVAEAAFEEGRVFEREQRQQPIASESYRQGCADIIDAVTAADERLSREQRNVQIICHDSDVGRLQRALVAANRRHLLGNVRPSPYAPLGTAYLIDRSQSERNITIRSRTIEGLTE